MSKNNNNKKVHPLEIAAYRYVEAMNNKLKQTNRDYYFSLEISSAPAEVTIPVLDRKTRKQVSTKKKKIMMGNLVFSVYVPKEDSDEGYNQAIIHHSQVPLLDLNERFNSYGWHGDLCARLLDTAFRLYSMNAIQQIANAGQTPKAEATS